MMVRNGETCGRGRGCEEIGGCRRYVPDGYFLKRKEDGGIAICGLSLMGCSEGGSPTFREQCVISIVNVCGIKSCRVINRQLLTLP
ncbi:hypothetical protein AVEN_266261-1 [Araneus ventricosus]|uniref:Uncharacterized protein n=1 Tax=Araneus ventricosus TaxID=182803 RepID=A0A4Y2G4K9_ARAVE|nr:hypothetical protein AVEN_266261-1 [Araneus ventricosus]